MLLGTISLHAQTTEEVLESHQTAMGSPEKWSGVKSLVMKNKFSVQGMDIESKSSILAQKEGSRIELVSKEKLDGADVFLLKVSKSDGEESQVYISATTYFIVKTSGKIKANGQEVDSEISYSNYKAVDGLFFPYTIETASPMGGMMTVDTVSIEINPAIDEAIFVKPSK